MHHLEILDKRLSITHVIQPEVQKRKGYKHQKTSPRERPVGLGYFTIGQYIYMLQEIQTNYLKELYVFTFEKETFFVRIISPEEKDITPSGSAGTVTLAWNQRKVEEVSANPVGGD